MNVVFMGTPDFAVPSLQYLIDEKYNVVCVVTQPDKPKGRGNKLSFSPIKEKALEFSIPVLQPVKISKDKDFIEKIRALKPDVIVVVAFGQILPAELLAIPKYGCINVHGSLLPRLRGAAPINWAIINGDKETGITTMFMDEGLDTGDMLLKESTIIGEDETAGELHDRLKIIGARLLIKTLESINDGTLKRVPQDNSLSTYAPMLNRDTGKIDWNRRAQDIKNLVRGTNPWPAAYSFLNKTRIKIWNVDICNTDTKGEKPGKVWKVDKRGIYVYTSDGCIIIKEVQTENGKRIGAYDYTLGHPISSGSMFEA